MTAKSFRPHRREALISLLSLPAIEPRWNQRALPPASDRKAMFLAPALPCILTTYRQPLLRPRPTRETRSWTRSTSNSRKSSAPSKTSNDSSFSSSRIVSTSNLNNRRLTKLRSNRWNSSTNNRHNTYSNNRNDNSSSYSPNSSPRTRTKPRPRRRSLSHSLKTPSGASTNQSSAPHALQIPGFYWNLREALSGIPLTFNSSIIRSETVAQEMSGHTAHAEVHCGFRI